MPRVDIVKSSEIKRTPRVMQIEGMFDLSADKISQESWELDFDLPDNWNIGVIVGPSGSGKTTLARELWGDNFHRPLDDNDERAVVDLFSSNTSVKQVAAALSSVGFSSPPAWVRQYRVLSNGEKFRCNMAHAILESDDLVVIDEYSSVIDRTVARIGSAAIQKAVRKHNKKAVMLSCHYDILDWLEPDWVLKPHTGEYYCGRYLHQRPDIKLDVYTVHRSAWRIFRKHHYLNTSIAQASSCYAAFFEDQPVAFTAVMHFPHPSSKNFKREHRTVCLPDYQGVGIGNALSNFIASLYKQRGYRYLSQTSHPAMISYRNKSDLWKMTKKPGLSPKIGRGGKNKWKVSSNRYLSSFEYVGD